MVRRLLPGRKRSEVAVADGHGRQRLDRDGSADQYAVDGLHLPVRAAGRRPAGMRLVEAVLAQEPEQGVVRRGIEVAADDRRSPGSSAEAGAPG